MTTKPKAKKFRIKRTPPADSAAAHPTANAAPTGAPTGDAPDYMQARRDSAAMTDQGGNSGGEMTVEQALDAIRHEGLTGRELRMARRVAQKHNLPATSDFDAVRLLRAAGIDPFQRSNMLELVVDEKAASAAGAAAKPGGKIDLESLDPELNAQKQVLGRIQLPQTAPNPQQNLPGAPNKEKGPSPAERRNREISDIQRDIARRRRRKMFLLMTRLAFFVMLPGIIAGYYYNFVATPMYATKSEFLILKNETSSSAMSGLLSGTQFATSQDAIAVQSFLESKDAMLRLDSDVGFKAHFAQPWIDPIQRLPEDASNEQAYKMYKRNITIGYDPTEGVIRMEITAADPQVSANYAERLIGYAEERVDQLSRAMRQNSVSTAELALERAKEERRKAQANLVRIQQEGSVLDPEAKIASLRTQISTYEIQLQEKTLALQAAMDNRRPNQAKVDGLNGDISRLENLLQTLNNEMKQASQGEDSLAQLAANIALAQSDLATADLSLQSALDQLQGAQREANSQVRYLTTAVKPVASQDPAYPRKFENTVLAFLIFAGIYLMVSLTASILREQVNT